MLKMPMFVHIVDSLTAWPRVRFRKLAGNCVKITYVRVTLYWLFILLGLDYISEKTSQQIFHKDLISRNIFKQVKAKQGLT